MKYFIRLLAALPMLGTGISMIVFVVMAFENPLWILEAIASFLSFMRLAQDYEWTVRDVAGFLRRMSDDAMYE